MILMLPLALAACGESPTSTPVTAPTTATTAAAGTTQVANNPGTTAASLPTTTALSLPTVTAGARATTAATPAKTETTSAASQTTAAAATTPAETTAAATTVAAVATTVASSAPTTVAASADTAPGVTMKTAYAAVAPVVKAWQDDAVYTAVYNPLDSGIGMNEQGRAAQWYFDTVSASTKKRATWLVNTGADGKPVASKSIEDELPDDRVQLLVNHKLPAIDSLIDTDRLMAVARDNGGTKSDRPVGTRLASPAKEGDPLAFDLVFYQGDNVVRLRIDAVSGKLVENVKG